MIANAGTNRATRNHIDRGPPVRKVRRLSRSLLVMAGSVA
jgi:hypothetical protein